MGKIAPAFFGDDAQVFHGHRRPFHREDDILEALGAARESAVF
jgi:hypothetical protein